ncbi:MAG: hypothetical protein IJK60_06595 [Clostridia bacterium]|nr:hypothetical protein [Clostridia bacterium]
MKKTDFSISKLFFNNKFLAAFSLVAAFIVWLGVAIVFAPEDERVIDDVPVKIELSQAMKTYGLKAFGDSDYKVDVTVKGKRYNVSKMALGAQDIEVRANTAFVNSAGKYTLQLVASNATNRVDFEITSLSIEIIDVYFDVEKTKEFEIDRNIIAPNGIVPDGYYAGEISLSESTVKITGPETEIDRIIGVNANVNIDEPITATKTVNCVLSAYNSTASEPRYLTYRTNQTDLTATVPVYRRVALNTGVEFVNSPAKYIADRLEYSVSPSSAVFGVAESRIDSLNGTISVGTIDFREINSEETEFKLSFDSESAVLIDDSVTEFTVKVNPGAVVKKEIEVPLSSVIFEGTPEGSSPFLGQTSVTVTVIGPAESLEKIDTGSFTVKADLSRIKNENELTEIPLTLTLTDNDDCWIFGNYSTMVTLL